MFGYLSAKKSNKMLELRSKQQKNVNFIISIFDWRGCFCVVVILICPKYELFSFPSFQENLIGKEAALVRGLCQI